MVETDGSAQARGSQQLGEHSGFGLCSNYDPRDPSMQIPTLSLAWAPKVCKIMALMAIIMGLGLLFSYFWGLGNVYRH